MTTAAAPASSPLQFIPLAQLQESKHNPRKHYDPAALAELADSLRSTGQLTPILARPIGNGKTPTYEIAAGHRRFRAAAIVGLETVQVIVREMDDAKFIEALNVENLQRKDIHPLEEARGFQDLITIARLDVAGIARRVGKSEKYVYDRIKLLDLIPKAKELFLADRFEAGHAILLARLTSADQERAIDPDEEALFQREHTLFHPERDEDAEGDVYDGLKARSVRELDAWIAKHVRLDLKRDTQALIFPDIAEKVVPAKEMNLKVIPITHDTFVQPDAKVEGERTFGPSSWKRADGLHDSKRCEYAVMGAIVVGPGRGEAFEVCIAKTKCTTHWKAEVKAAQDREKAKANGSSSTKGGATAAAPAKPSWQVQQEREEAQRKAEDAVWVTAGPLVLEALAAGVKKAATGVLADIVLSDRGVDKRAEKYFPRGRTAEDVLRHMVFRGLPRNAEYPYGRQELARLGKRLGVDVAAIVKAATDTAKAETKAAAVKAESKKAPAKSPAKKAKKAAAKKARQ